MLRITVHVDGDRCRLQLSGRLCGPWVGETAKVWHPALCSGKEIEVDMREVTGIDDTGRELLVAMHIAGEDRKSTRLNSSHSQISYAVFCLQNKPKEQRAVAFPVQQQELQIRNDGLHNHTRIAQAAAGSPYLVAARSRPTHRHLQPHRRAQR